MPDTFRLNVNQSIRSLSGTWYRNVQVLGTGGNAITFLVVATSGPHRGVPFAMKVFRRLSLPERRERFLREIEFLQGCDHPSVLRVFDRGVQGAGDAEYPFVVAEYLAETLDSVIKAGRTSVVVKISYALQLLSALSYLASLRPAIIHRDIKPKNIFVKGGSCVLGDFGLFKAASTAPEDDREVFKESLGAGMPARYRTPDQVDYLHGRSNLTPSSDIFQLGLVLAELFTGVNPQRPGALEAPIELEALRSFPGSFSRPIGNIINSMLAMDPAERPAVSTLQAALEGQFENVVKQAHLLEGRAIW